MFWEVCEALRIQRGIKLCYPLEISQLNGLECQERITVLSVKYNEKTEGRPSDFAHGHLKGISDQMTFLLGLKKLV